MLTGSLRSGTLSMGRNPSKAFGQKQYPYHPERGWENEIMEILLVNIAWSRPEADYR